jgi:hypothetical protein
LYFNQKDTTHMQNIINVRKSSVGDVSTITQYDMVFSQGYTQRFLILFYLPNKTTYSDFLLYVRIFHKLDLMAISTKV